MKAAGLITVAGRSARMGAFKPLLPINEKPMNAHTADVFRKAGVEDLFVVVGKNGEDVIRALSEYDAHFIWNDAYETTEMLVSVQIGLTAIRTVGGFDGAFLLPGDMPAVPPKMLRALAIALERGGYDAVFPSDGKRRLHPPLIGASLFDELIAYAGVDGLRGAFRGLQGRIGYVTTSEEGCEIDIDTPADYARACAILTDRRDEVTHI